MKEWVMPTLRKRFTIIIVRPVGRRPILLLCLLAASALAGEAVAAQAEAVAGVFAPAAGRQPRPGEWLEYLVAFPVDPLENELRSDPAPPLPAPGGRGAAVVELADGLVITKPEFDPPESWRIVPLRLEVLGRAEQDLQVRMTFAGVVHETVLPTTPVPPAVGFRYDEPQPENREIEFRLGDASLMAEVTSRVAENHGFIRYWNAELPFGLARFATGDVDLVLVGMGEGTPPAYPLRLRTPPEPPPGTLYVREASERR